MKRKQMWYLLFAVYSCMMLFLLFDRTGYEAGVPYQEQLKYNLVPFHTIHLFVDALKMHTYRTSAVVNLFGNVIMFIPLGFLLPRVFSGLRCFWWTMLTVTGIIVTVEILQMFTLVGTCDIDDLILNLLGASIGYGIHFGVKKILSK